MHRAPEPSGSTMRVGILLYQQHDLLDSGGPYEVFLTAARLAVRDGDPPAFEVVTITPSGASIDAYGGLGLTPALGASAVDDLDVLVVPGTVDVDAALADHGLVDAVARLHAVSRLTASVYTGAFLLGALGLLEGRPWTTHWEDVDALAARVGPEGATRGVRWVDAGPVVTGGGLSSGIAMALHLVDRLASRDLADRTARQLDYDWSPEPGAAGRARRARPRARSAPRFRASGRRAGGALSMVLVLTKSSWARADPPS